MEGDGRVGAEPAWLTFGVKEREKKPGRNTKFGERGCGLKWQMNRSCSVVCDRILSLISVIFNKRFASVMSAFQQD